MQQESGEERRRANRMPQEALVSSRGWVLDLSTQGMRVRCPRRLRGRLRVTIGDGDDQVTMRAEVRWSRRAGLCQHDIGLRFLEVDARQAERLARMAVNNRPRRKLSDLQKADAAPAWALSAHLGGPTAGPSLLE